VVNNADDILAVVVPGIVMRVEHKGFSGIILQLITVAH
jgi:hypothetical protein